MEAGAGAVAVDAAAGADVAESDGAAVSEARLQPASATAPASKHRRGRTCVLGIRRLRVAAIPEILSTAIAGRPVPARDAGNVSGGRPAPSAC